MAAPSFNIEPAASSSTYGPAASAPSAPSPPARPRDRLSSAFTWAKSSRNE